MNGIITLVFDDGYADVYEHVLPLLRRHGIHAVFAIPVRSEEIISGQKQITSLTVWKSVCSAEGHELAAHGVFHRPLTSLSNEELAKELEESRAATDATTVVYPGGAVDERVKKAAASVFQAGRTTAWGVESLPPSDPFMLRTLNATQKNFHWWKFGPRELLSAIAGRWVIETFHRVTPHPESRHDVSVEAFKRHLEWLMSLSVRFATIRDVINEQ